MIDASDIIYSVCARAPSGEKFSNERLICANIVKFLNKNGVKTIRDGEGCSTSNMKAQLIIWHDENVPGWSVEYENVTLATVSDNDISDDYISSVHAMASILHAVTFFNAKFIDSFKIKDVEFHKTDRVGYEAALDTCSIQIDWWTYTAAGRGDLEIQIIPNHTSIAYMTFSRSFDCAIDAFKDFTKYSSDLIRDRVTKLVKLTKFSEENSPKQLMIDELKRKFIE